MSRLLIYLLLLLFTFNMNSEDVVYSVEWVHHPDSSIRLPNKYDLNNDVAAQLEILADGISYSEVEGNVLGGIVNLNNRHVLYVCDGTRHIRLYSDGNIPLDIDFTKFDDTKGGVKGEEFYLLRISQKRPKQPVGLGSRILTFKSDEPLDSIIVDGNSWQLNESVAQKLVPFGDYSYKAYSHGYPLLNGTVTVIGGIGSKIVKLKFKN